MKGVHRFGVKGKLAPRYVGPFKITEQSVGRLLTGWSYLHISLRFMTYFMSRNLRKCRKKRDTSQIEIEPDLTYEERPIKILDQKQRATRRKAINFYKVQWSNHSEEEATWEQEEYLQTKYPGFLSATTN
ncbi:LOW QUALITY PROTEIN: hypothetical protein U9M48_027654, partial [Paspalum notatum var. saurae]